MRGLMQATYRVPVRKTCWIDSVIPPRRASARSHGRSASSWMPKGWVKR